MNGTSTDAPAGAVRTIPARHWFFDFDGTLADTDPDIRGTWTETLAELGLECPHFASVYKTGPTLDDISRMLFPGADGELLEKIRSGFKRNYDKSPLSRSLPYPGVEEWLCALRRAGRKLYILTNKRFTALKRLVSAYGWDGLFDGLYAGDMDPARKRQKSELFAFALRERGIAPEDAVVAGDTAGDVDAAHRNGAAALGVTWGYGADSLGEADFTVDAPPAADAPCTAAARRPRPGARA